MANDKVIGVSETTPQDALLEVLREGARRLLNEAIEAEVQDLLGRHSERRLADGRAAVVRNGRLPVRELQTLGGRVRLLAGRHRQKMTEPGGFALHFVTDLIAHAVRENPVKQGTFPNRVHF